MAIQLLLIDNSVTIQKVVELTFADPRYLVLKANNLQEAAFQIQQRNPDLIIADTTNEQIDSRTFCDHLKNDPDHHAIPIILLVGKFTNDEEQRRLLACADTILSKPFDAAELRELVTHLLEERRAEEVAEAQAARRRRGADDLRASPELEEISSPEDEARARAPRSISEADAEALVSGEIEAATTGSAPQVEERKAEPLRAPVGQARPPARVQREAQLGERPRGQPAAPPEPGATQQPSPPTEPRARSEAGVTVRRSGTPPKAPDAGVARQFVGRAGTPARESPAAPQGAREAARAAAPVAARSVAPPPSQTPAGQAGMARAGGAAAPAEPPAAPPARRGEATPASRTPSAAPPPGQPPRVPSEGGRSGLAVVAGDVPLGPPAAPPGLARGPGRSAPLVAKREAAAAALPRDLIETSLRAGLQELAPHLAETLCSSLQRLAERLVADAAERLVPEIATRVVSEIAARVASDVLERVVPEIVTTIAERLVRQELEAIKQAAARGEEI